MTPVSLVSVAASLLSLVLSIWLLVAVRTPESMQRDLLKKQQELRSQQQTVQAQEQALQAQQQRINTGNQIQQQIAPKVVQAIGQTVVQKKNEKLRGLLSKYKIEITEKPAGAPAAGGAAAPAAPSAPANN